MQPAKLLLLTPALLAEAQLTSIINGITSVIGDATSVGGVVTSGAGSVASDIIVRVLMKTRSRRSSDLLHRALAET